MAKPPAANLVLLALGLPSPAAREFPPGFVDSAPLLAAVAEEVGEAELRCITSSGGGYAGAAGQTRDNAAGVDRVPWSGFLTALERLER